MALLALITEKFCRKCGTTQPLGEFTRNPKSRDGLRCYCKSCDRNWQREFYQTERGKLTRARTKKKHRQAYYVNPNRRGWVMWDAAKNRAKQKGIEFNLRKEWVQDRIERGICELSGLKFDLSLFNKSTSNPYAPSIDRKDNNRGYTEDNCRVICYALNAALGHWGELTFRDLATAYLEKTGSAGTRNVTISGYLAV